MVGDLSEIMVPRREVNRAPVQADSIFSTEEIWRWLLSCMDPAGLGLGRSMMGLHSVQMSREVDICDSAALGKIGRVASDNCPMRHKII